MEEDPFTDFGERMGFVRREQADVRRQIGEAETAGDLDKIPGLIERLVELRGRELDIFRDVDELGTDKGQAFIEETQAELEALRKGNAGYFKEMIGSETKQYYGLKAGIEDQTESFDTAIAMLEDEIETANATLERIDDDIRNDCRR